MLPGSAKMMLLFVSTFFSFAIFAGMVEIRDLFSKSASDESATERLIELTKSATLESNTLLYAYHAAAIMSMANHVSWPGTKLAYFKDGKDKLEKAVNYALTNVEIRFVRYAVQLGAPTMLGYYQKLAEDKAYILKNINKTDWSDTYKLEVREFLNKS